MHKLLQPNLTNFLCSFREIGYSSEVAIADILDNSITADANKINIYAFETPQKKIIISDNGIGMNNNELEEAMRLSSKNPNDVRSEKDLGRFGLGLKVASFSQCKKLTVLSKKEKNKINAIQWDLKYIAENNDWYALIPNLNDYKEEVKELDKHTNGTIVIWEEIDKMELSNFSDEIEKIVNHIGLVFHKYIEGINGKKIKFLINNNEIKPLNPFFPSSSRQELPKFKYNYDNGNIVVTPYILPHHNNVNELEFKKYALQEGYLKSQGFYLYRKNRLVSWGNWWGLTHATEALKLIRIEIEIPNTMDSDWNIDLKKSSAKPPYHIRQDLKNVITFTNPVGKRVYTNRTPRKNKPDLIHIWDYKPKRNDSNKKKFKINRDHPLIDLLIEQCSQSGIEILNALLIGLEEYLPIDTISAQLFSNPKEIDQSNEDDEFSVYLKNILNDKSLTSEQKAQLLKTEFYKNEQDSI
jgi:hypothetical protein